MARCALHNPQEYPLAPIRWPESDTPRGLPRIYRPHDLWMDDAPTKLSLTQESGNRGLVLSEFVLEDFERDSPVFWVFGAIYYCSAPFPDAVENGIACDYRSNERVFSHAEKLTPNDSCGKRNDMTGQG